MKARLMRRLALTMVAVGGPLFSQALVWQRTNGPYKATVRALAITSQDELLAGTDGGLYRSSDNGATWKLESLAGLFWTHQEPQVNAILANPAGLLIVGEEYGGIVRSADDGASWTRSDFPYESHVRSLASTNSDVLYAGTYQDGMYRSTDLGLSWHKTSVTSPSVSCLYVDPEGQIYGGADGAIIRSTDDGGRWEYASIQAGSVRSIQMSPNGLLFAGAWGGGLFISTDKGTTWNARNQNIPRLDIDALAFDSTGNFYAGITVTGLYRSVDEGLSWTRVGFTNEDVFSLLVIRSNTLVTGSFLGIHISADAGATFEEKNIGLMNTYPTVLVNTTTGSMFATLNGRGLYRSLDGGSDWTRLWTEDVGGITADARGNVYVGKDNGIWKSSDNGDDWTTLQVPFFPYVITVDDNVIYGGTWDGNMFCSGDGGANWQRIRSDGDYGTIRAIRLNHLRHVFVTVRYKGVFRSTDGGRDWQEISTMSTTRYVYDLLVDPLDRLFLATDNGVFCSTDNGNSWELPSAGMQLRTAWCLSMDSNQQLFAGTTDGVYSSNDLGKSWGFVSPDGPRGLVLAIQTSPTGFVSAGTNGQGLFRTASPTASRPEQQTLSQNFPNPFNSSTTISFELSAPSDAELAIFNTLGQKIETLIDWRLAAGRYSIDWRPRTVSSGVYFYRLITASSADTRKIVFLK